MIWSILLTPHTMFHDLFTLGGWVHLMPNVSCNLIFHVLFQLTALVHPVHRVRHHVWKPSLKAITKDAQELSYQCVANQLRLSTGVHNTVWLLSVKFGHRFSLNNILKRLPLVLATEEMEYYLKFQLQMDYISRKSGRKLKKELVNDEWWKYSCWHLT